MLALLAAGIAGASGVFGHIQCRHFVGQRLRYTSIVDKPMLGLWAGVGATVVAAPLVAVLPIAGPPLRWVRASARGLHWACGTLENLPGC
ncbi:MAG: hypothetical protein ACPHWZ_14950 [Longimicrobiales bacterium]